MNQKTTNPVADAPLAQLAVGRDRSLGAVLIDAGRLTAGDAEKILRLQKKKSLRFGDAGIELGVLTPADIQFGLSLQFDYPYLQPSDERLSQELVAAFKPFSPIVEQLRVLRSQLMLRLLNGTTNRRGIAITSVSRGEGRSFVAANLAIVFSQLGERTLLIDADLRHPRQHELFRLSNKVGLSSILAGRAGRECIVRIKSLLDLSVLPSGAVPPNPQELLGRHQYQELLQELVESYDVIIVDTPAATDSADVQVIAARLGGALLVARKDLSFASSMQRLNTSLEHVNVSVVGAVLNDF